MDLNDRDREDVLSWAESVLEHEASRRFFEDFDHVESEAEWVDETGVILPRSGGIFGGNVAHHRLQNRE